MTVGFPDWSRLQLQGGQQLYDVQLNLTGIVVSGVIDCLGFASIQTSVNDLGNLSHKEVVVRFYTDNSGSVQINSRSWIVTPGSEDFHTIPCMGRFMTISIQNLDAPNGETVNIMIYGTNAATPQIGPNANSAPVIQGSGGVSAGSSLTIFGSTTVDGAGTLSAIISATNNWNANLQFWSKVAIGWVDLYFVTGASFGQSATVRISFPPSPIRLVLSNTDAAGHTMWGAVTAG